MPALLLVADVLAVEAYCLCEGVVAGDGTGTADVAVDGLHPPRRVLDRVLPRLLPDLLLCPQCAVVRCDLCTTTRIVSKYCPLCMALVDSTAKVCTRDCFTCPVCPASLSVSRDSEGRVEYRCGGCSYVHTPDLPAGQLTRAVLRHLRQALVSSPLHTRTAALRKLLLSMAKPAARVSTATPGQRLLASLPPDLRPRIADAKRKSAEPAETVGPVPFPEEEDRQRGKANAPTHAADGRGNGGTITLRQLLLHWQSTSPVPPSTCPWLPIPTRLKAKRQVLCGACDTLLVDPDPDPVSLKFRTNALLMEVFPLVRVAPARDPDGGCRVVLTLVNGTPVLADYSLTVCPRVGVNVGGVPMTLGPVVPYPAGTLGPRPAKMSKPEQVAAATPTIVLVDPGSSAGRVELMNRLGQQQLAGETGADGDTAQGVNWGSTPIDYTLVERMEAPTAAVCVGTPVIPLHLGVKHGDSRVGLWLALPVADNV